MKRDEKQFIEKRSPRLKQETRDIIFMLITSTKQSREEILRMVEINEIKATDDQIFKLLEKWVEEKRIMKIGELTDGRTRRYYKPRKMW